MDENGLVTKFEVRCRIGSLESFNAVKNSVIFVRCRIGSLEIIKLDRVCDPEVRCRIGSLEMSPTFGSRITGSLPYRQLRNTCSAALSIELKFAAV